MRTIKIASIFTILLISISINSAMADFAIPGCEDAWDAIVKAGNRDDLKTLVVNDCAILYRRGWRLPIHANKAGNVKPDICGPAWNNLSKREQQDNARFMVTHNCPVFYRKGWVLPPSQNK